MTDVCRHSNAYGGWRQLLFLTTYRWQHPSRADAAFTRHFHTLTEQEQDSVAHIIIHAARHPDTPRFSFAQYFTTAADCNIFPFAQRVSETIRAICDEFHLCLKYGAADSLIIDFERVKEVRIPASFAFYQSDLWDFEELNETDDEEAPPNKRRLLEAPALDSLVGV